MKKLFISFVFIFSFHQTIGQTLLDTLRRNSKDSISTPLFVSFFVLKRENRDSLISTNLVINMLNVKSDYIYYKKNRENHIEAIFCSFDLLAYTPLIDFNDFCKIYNISEEEQKAIFFLDSEYAYKIKETYFELGTILSVTKIWDKQTGKKYINIKTLFPKIKTNDAF